LKTELARFEKSSLLPMGRRTIMSNHPNNGSTFSKATYDNKRPIYEPRDSARAQAQLEQDMRDAADIKLLKTDPKTWLRKHGG
jgi:hypothetical protein